jgi:hypothetical protein
MKIWLLSPPRRRRQSDTAAGSRGAAVKSPRRSTRTADPQLKHAGRVAALVAAVAASHASAQAPPCGIVFRVWGNRPGARRRSFSFVAGRRGEGGGGPRPPAPHAPLPMYYFVSCVLYPTFLKSRLIFNESSHFRVTTYEARACATYGQPIMFSLAYQKEQRGVGHRIGLERPQD